MKEVDMYLLKFYEENYKEAKSDFNKVKEQYFDKTKRNHEESLEMRDRYEEALMKKNVLAEMIADVVVKDTEELKEDEEDDGKRLCPCAGNR